MNIETLNIAQKLLEKIERYQEHKEYVQDIMSKEPFLVLGTKSGASAELKDDIIPIGFRDFVNGYLLNLEKHINDLQNEFTGL